MDGDPGRYRLMSRERRECPGSGEEREEGERRREKGEEGKEGREEERKDALGVRRKKEGEGGGGGEGEKGERDERTDEELGKRVEERENKAKGEMEGGGSRGWVEERREE